MAQVYDIIIVGAGIAGASVAAYLAEHKRTIIVEMEDRPGFHTTSRSAASYEPNYGPSPILALTRASHKFFMEPPAFIEGSLFTLRPSLFFEADGQSRQTAMLIETGSGLKELNETEALQVFPILRSGYARRIFMDQNTGDLDVDLLHNAYLKLFRARGGQLLTNAPAEHIRRTGGIWTIHTSSGDISAPLLVNAAGAWGDVVAQRAEVKPVGLEPRRRSIALVPAPDVSGFADFPLTTDVGETWYAKPQSGAMIVSSADATPVEPHDAYADDMAVAEGIDRLMQATTIEVTRLIRSWGGLRTFAPDGMPVVGFDPSAEGFFWLAGQGGYGIQSAPALSRVAAAMVLGRAIPDDVLEKGLKIADIMPDRFKVRINPLPDDK